MSQASDLHTKYQLEKFNLSRSGPFFERVFLGGFRCRSFKKNISFFPKKSGMNIYRHSAAIVSKDRNCIQHCLPLVKQWTWDLLRETRWGKLERTTCFLQYLDAGFNHFDLDFCLGEDFHFDKPIYIESLIVTCELQFSSWQFFLVLQDIYAKAVKLSFKS